MKRFLTFTLFAPIASFGAIAVGERRESWSRPARSAVLGLVGACLGIEREDAEEQAALEREFGFALLCGTSGGSLADFHTLQVGRPARGQTFRTRAEELNSNTVDTILTRRDYRVSAWHLAALWVRSEVDPRWALEDLADAMKQPAFTPYLGRRACPLGLPLAPQIIDADSPASALDRRWASGPEAEFRPSLAGTIQDLFVARDRWVGDEGANNLLRSEERRDAPISRTLWQFGLRTEVIEAFSPTENRS